MRAANAEARMCGCADMSQPWLLAKAISTKISYNGLNCPVITVKPVLSSHSKRRPKIGFQDRLALNAGQKYCRMLQETFIKLPFVFKTLVLSIFEWPLYCTYTLKTLNEGIIG